MTTRLLSCLAGAFLLASGPVFAQKTPDRDQLTFQTNKPWSPRVNINAGSVMVYGIDESMPARIRSWREHGYRVTVMTGVAWGEYAPYLRGDFDGKEHWDETQQEKSGKLILHSGREVPYMAPSVPYGLYLAQGVTRAIDAGAEAIYLEEPEFWARAGWSEGFKREWQSYYHEDWRAPDSSPDAQYRASKLKYFLYRRALGQVFASVKKYGIEHHRKIPCYVATHSLINYAQWQIVSPESSLLDVGADGYIAQVWTGTSREPNVYEGLRRERTFETAFLEYGALQNIARSSGKRIWYLNDPIEDNPNHSWVDYRKNWESTLTASLLQPEVSRYEVLPWPDRIFGPKSLHLVADATPERPKPEKTLIPHAYETELQTVFHALGEMKQPASSVRWQNAGTQGIGVLVSDTLMFQRISPDPSDSNLGHVYGLALPMLMRGMPVEPVQIESTYKKGGADFLKPYKVLLLSYEGQKPPSNAFHTAIASWVRAGGALVMVDDDKDPYNQVTDWWNSGGNNFDNPREDLFRQLGIPSNAVGLNHVGKGIVLYAADSPSALTYRTDGANALRTLVHQATDAIGLTWKESNALILRRGPYLIGSGLDGSGDGPAVIHGDFIDLFDANLKQVKTISISTGDRILVRDANYGPCRNFCILAVSGKVTEEHATATSLSFKIEGIEQTESVIRIRASKDPGKITLNGKVLPASQHEYNGSTVLIQLTNTSNPQIIRLVR